MNLARKAIPELDSPEHADEETRMRVLEKLRSFDFGKNGYFYVYDLNGTNLMHPWWRDLEHKKQWNLTDDQGHPIIQQLIRAAREGGLAGGFLRYRWPRPPHPNQWNDKLGYVVRLPNWGWMLGTGIYLDDIAAIKQTTQQIQASSTAAIARTTCLIALIAVLAVLVVAALGVALNVSQQHLADAKLRKLTWRVVAAEEQERARVSRYLHDEAMQDLIAVKLVLETVLVELRRDSSHDRVVAMLERGLAGLTEGVDQIRQVSHGLRPRLQSDGLPDLLEQTGAAFSKRTGLPTIVDAKVVPQPMSAEAATALFRVTQQAMENVNRHAHATRVTIRLAHVAVIDISFGKKLSDMGGLTLTRKLREHYRETRVLIWSMHGDDDHVAQARVAGAHGYILKSCSMKQIVKAIEVVAGGGRYYSAEVEEVSVPKPRLTAREREILTLVAHAKSSREIARELKIDCRTVESHRRNIMDKLDAKNVVEMITIAYRLGLIDFME